MPVQAIPLALIASLYPLGLAAILLLPLVWLTIDGPGENPRLNRAELDYLRAGGALIARVAPALGAAAPFLQQAATPSAAEGRAAAAARRR